MITVKSADVVVAAGRIARVVMVTGDEADVVWCDHAGRIVRRVFPLRSLKPFRVASQPRSLWPDSLQGGDDVRTRAPNASKKTRNSRKPRPSKKAKLH
jgi:hypothetical protein